MSYYTRFELDVKMPEGSVMFVDNEDVIDDFRHDCEGAKYCLTEDGGSGEPGKWYDYQSDLVGFSKKYPEIEFTLHGEGEEAGDLWRLVVKDGKSKKVDAVITYPEITLEDLT